MRIRTACLTGLLAVGMGMNITGCSFRKAKAKVPPPPVRLPPSTVEAAKPEPLPPPPDIAWKPEIAGLPGPPIDSTVEPPKPQMPKPTARSPRAGTTPEQSTQPETTPAEPLPALVPLLTAGEQETYNRDIDELVMRAEADLKQVGNRNLSDRQKLDVARARAFIQQVRDTRRTDLVAARNLAQRAALLAESVASSLR